MSIPKECKRLAEVDFPIATVSKHSAREKSRKSGTVLIFAMPRLARQWIDDGCDPVLTRGKNRAAEVAIR